MTVHYKIVTVSYKIVTVRYKIVTVRYKIVTVCYQIVTVKSTDGLISTGGLALSCASPVLVFNSLLCKCD